MRSDQSKKSNAHAHDPKVMGYLMFFGCIFIAFGPISALFFLVVGQSPRLVILAIGRY